ncbi:MAG: periplasmic heavy metal sensor [Bacteroidales bacterium]|jgi:Spy/CpxP family protein refolding chaperone|nr:periplasmic heavy metal sensor [Bacteroidales bacterium]
METITRNRVLFWLLIFLIIVNLAALATYFILPEKQQPAGCAGDPNSPECILHSRLNLTDEQNEHVERINSEYRVVSQPLSQEIKQLRGHILDELESGHTDTVLTNNLTGEIAALQLQLHRENILHYLALKEVCDPEQALLLSNLYREMYGCPMHQEMGKPKHHRLRGR